MSVQQRRSYYPEFKSNELLLAEEPDHSVRNVAESLEIAIDFSNSDVGNLKIMEPDLLKSHGYHWRKI